MPHILDLHEPWKQAIKQTLTIKQLEIANQKTLNRVSVVFVAVGSIQEALASLVSLLAQDLVREIVIVDCIQNAEFSSRIDTMTRAYARIHLIPGHAQMPLAEAYNMGRKQTISKFILFLKSPGVLAEDLLNEMLLLGSTKSVAWIIGMNHEQCQFDPFLKLLPHSQSSQPMPLPDGGVLVPALANSCFLISQEFLHEIGGFDSDCINENLLLDFCLRIHQMGGEVISDEGFEPPKPMRNLPNNPSNRESNLKAQFLSWEYYYHKHFGKSYNKKMRVLLYLKLFYAQCVKRLARLIQKFSAKPTPNLPTN